MSQELIPFLARSLLALYLCTLAPGQAWWRGRLSSVPRLWAQVLVSVIGTTAVAAALTALESFSLASVVLANGLLTFAGFLYQLLVRGRGDEIPVWHDRIGPLVFVAALIAYWPPYPAFLASGDASAYLDTGVYLARTGRLAVEDDLGPTLQPVTRTSLFDSMSQVIGGGGPPYRRTPGALLIRTREDTRAWPAFFPVPSIWAALATEIAGARAAPAYATFFAALAVWTTFVLARRWLALPWAMLATVLVAGNGAAWYAAHLSMSEPLVWYFTWAGLTAAAAFDHKRGSADAALAAAAFGAALLVRIDFAIFLVGALVLLPSFRADDAGGESTSAPLPGSFFAILLAWGVLAVAEVAIIPGSYADPLSDSSVNARVFLLYAFVHHAWLTVLSLLAAAAALAASIWRLGMTRTIRFGIVAGFLVAHAMASSFLPTRTPVWLSCYIGWAGMAVAVGGALVIWRERSRMPGAALFLALVAATSLVLFYNPHVHPTLPWGARRFVPVLLPGLLLMTVVAAAHTWTRNRALGAVAAVAVLAGVAMSGRPVWGQRLFEGAPEQLEEIAKVIPQDGIIAINRTLGSHMIAPALWMLYGRNNVSVYPDTIKEGRNELSALVQETGKPVYFVTGGIEPPRPIPFVRGSLVGRARLHLPLLETTHDRLPAKTERYLAPIAVYRLERSFDGKGEKIR